MLKLKTAKIFILFECFGFCTPTFCDIVINDTATEQNALTLIIKELGCKCNWS